MHLPVKRTCFVFVLHLCKIRQSHIAKNRKWSVSKVRKKILTKHLLQIYLYIHIFYYYMDLYFNLCLRVQLDSLLCSYTFISFLTTHNWSYINLANMIIHLICCYNVSQQTLSNESSFVFEFYLLVGDSIKYYFSL